MKPDTLIVPGWNGSGPTHWQTLWEQTHPGFERVQQRDWNAVVRAEWVETLGRAVAAAGPGVTLVAHSLGAITVAAWAVADPAAARQVACALLVAPPELEQLPALPPALADFARTPRARLPFPSLLVGSENDPYASLAAAARLAADWGSRFVNAGPVGHVNVQSGHGPWPQGERLLAELRAARPGNVLVLR